MDLSWVNSLAELLFGRLGALGTLFVATTAYIAWQLHREQQEHAESRKRMEELNEKRLALHEENIRSIESMKVALNNLAEVIRRKRGPL